MKTLVLGGTVFLSYAIAEECVRRGHEVTCLARGEAGSVPAGATLVRADRAQGRSAYAQLNGDWDIVVDVSWEPGHVREALEALADRTRHWTYVSSCSVYADNGGGALDESAALLGALEPGGVASLEKYGEAKVACEESCHSAIGTRLHICRPGLIGGPGDPSDRFGYWPARFARHLDDNVLVPDSTRAMSATIDVRDLAAWIVTAGESGIVGTMNALGEPRLLSEVLVLAQRTAEHRGAMVAVGEGWLLDHGVAPWSGKDSLPLWIPRTMGFDVFSKRSSARALEFGLVRRSIEETLSVALAFERRAGLERERHAGLSPARESELLSQWSSDGFKVSLSG
ncbi:MAG: NAD-dependent epimerase/dehydratase family protein [Acidimicrobiales bacterium]